GPWSHQLNSGRRVADVDYGPDAVIDLDGLALRWFDRWLKEEPNGIDEKPPVRLFVMRENAWRDETAWPLPSARPTRYYLAGDGRTNSLLGERLLSLDPPGAGERSDRYTYNPERPVPAIIDDETRAESLYADRRPIERRDDVLVYTS